MLNRESFKRKAVRRMRSAAGRLLRHRLLLNKESFKKDAVRRMRSLAGRLLRPA